MYSMRFTSDIHGHSNNQQVFYREGVQRNDEHGKQHRGGPGNGMLAWRSGLQALILDLLLKPGSGKPQRHGLCDVRVRDRKYKSFLDG
jgi:hypothetical protein